MERDYFHRSLQWQKMLNHAMQRTRDKIGPDGIS
jgi:hypothetical protein